jgi:hypothetical protein
MKESIHLDQDTLAAPGRVAWTAMNLEDWASSVCRHALGSDADSIRFIGNKIDRSIGRLKSWADPELDAAIEWLGSAKTGMTTRNQILHAVPVQSLAGAHGVVFMRRNKAGRPIPAIETAIDVPTLSAIADELEQVLDGYRGVLVKVAGAAKQHAA